MKKRFIRIWMDDPHDDLDIDTKRDIERKIKAALEDADMKNIDMEFYDDEKGEEGEKLCQKVHLGR